MTLDRWAARLAGRSEAAWWRALNAAEKVATMVTIDGECLSLPGACWDPRRLRTLTLQPCQNQTRSMRRGQRASPAPSLLAASPAPPALPPPHSHQNPSRPTLVPQEPHSQNNSSITPVNSPQCRGGVEV